MNRLEMIVTTSYTFQGHALMTWCLTQWNVLFDILIIRTSKWWLKSSQAPHSCSIDCTLTYPKIIPSSKNRFIQWKPVTNKFECCRFTFRALRDLLESEEMAITSKNMAIHTYENTERSFMVDTVVDVQMYGKDRLGKWRLVNYLQASVLWRTHHLPFLLRR